MSLLWIDGFDHYGNGNAASAAMNYGASCNPSTNAAAPRTGTGGAALDYTATFYKTLDAPVPICGVHIAVKDRGQLPGFGIRWSRAGAFCGGYYVNPSNAIVIRNSAGTDIATSANNVVQTGAYQVIEAKFTRGTGANGAIEVRVNGTAVVIATGVNFSASDPDRVEVANYGQGGIGVQAYVDDFIIWDGAGTINNDFLGPSKVGTLYPNSDDALFQWAKSTGVDGWAILDNVPPVTGTYVEALVNGDVAQTNLTDLLNTAISVSGVQFAMVARASDATLTKMRQGIKSGAFVYNGPEKSLTTSDARYNDICELDPNGSIPWTPTSVNAAQGRLTRTL